MPKKPPTHKPAGTRKRRENRGTSAQRGYGSRWQRARKTYLAKHPLCVRCEQGGRTEPATVVDHVTPHKGDWTLFWDSGNWQPLCKPCHDQKTAREDGGFGYRNAEASVPASVATGADMERAAAKVAAAEAEGAVGISRA